MARDVNKRSIRKFAWKIFGFRTRRQPAACCATKTLLLRAPFRITYRGWNSRSLEGNRPDGRAAGGSTPQQIHRGNLALRISALRAAFCHSSARQHVAHPHCRRHPALRGMASSSAPLSLTGLKGQRCSVFQRRWMVSSRERLQELLGFIASRIWISYRCSFASLGMSFLVDMMISRLSLFPVQTPAEPTKLTTDRGWGCMLRCGQMMLAEALLRRNEHLGASADHRRLLLDFADRPDAPFSIHQITTAGAQLSVPVGHWFGPNTVAHAIK